MEMDSQTAMKRSSTGITNVIHKKEAPTGEPRRVVKKWGAGENVGISLRLKKPNWLALHEAARDEGTNVTQLILTWLDEHRRKRGLPPVKE
jgi:predicted DNA-binding ribbon-helix-helix protein